jgi:tRNA(fMet)-specific endonuclease VapC
MTWMLDTCTLIHLIREQDMQLIEKFRSWRADEILVSSITVAEMEYGAAKSARPEQNRDALYQFLSPLTLVPFDPKAAGEYGLIRASLEKAGKPIGAMDMLIAAHAKSLGAIIVTDNTKEFQRIQGLSIENWIRR